MNDVLVEFVGSYIKEANKVGSAIALLCVLSFSVLGSASAAVDPLLQPFKIDPIPVTSAAPTPAPVVVAPTPGIPPQLATSTPNVPKVLSTPVPQEKVPAQQLTTIKVPDTKSGKETIKVTTEQLELGKISRTITSTELKRMNVELVATDKLKPMTVTLGSTKVNLEVPIVGYLLKENKVTPSPMAVPVASPDAGYKFGDTDIRNLKLMYNSLLEKANVNPTTAQRFQESLREFETFIRELDGRKAAVSEVNVN